MKNENKTKGKCIEELSVSEWVIIFKRVNFPNPQKGVLLEDEGRKRESLYQKIIQDADMDANGDSVKFDNIDGGDLFIKNVEWNLLKDLFESGGAENMWQRQRAKKLLSEKIENASDCTLDKEGKLVGEKSEVIEQLENTNT